MSAPAKPEAAAPAKAAAPAAGAAPNAPAAAASGGGMKAWLPVIVALVAAPAATWATVEFVLVPRLQKKIAAAHPAEGEHGAAGDGHGASAPAAHAPAAHSAPPPPAAKPGKDGKEGKGAGGPGYEFTNVVVNLAGTMGTRYLKTSFLVTGKDPSIQSSFEAAKPKVTDITLNVLSSLTLADIEEAGSKNIIREKLVTAYNQALGRKLVEQVYFSDFVVQ